MEESTSKGDDAGNDDKSPPKKARFDDQQPSTSTGSKATTPANGTAGNRESTENGEDATQNNTEKDVSKSEEATAASISGALSTLEGAEASGQTRRNPETASTSTNGTNEEAENPPAAASNANRERLLGNMRRLDYRALYGRNDDDHRYHEPDHPYDESSDDDIDLGDEAEAGRIREELTNELADLLTAQQRFGGNDNSDDSSDGDQDANGDDAAAVAAAGAADADNEQAEHFMEYEYESDDSSSDSFSESSNDSDESLSEESSPGSSESEIAHEDNPAEPEVVDFKNLECLKTDTLKGSWDIMREMRQRQHGLPLRSKSFPYNPSQFQKRAYGSMHMMKRLSLLHRLEHHTGCVNSLSFNSSGKLLASGSDDLHVNLWHWESKKLLKSIESGHRSNVFQTKFMEYKGYEGELEIISTGRDGHVRHTRVDPSGRATTELLFRGHTPIHKIAIPARDEFSFLTAGEDGKVRMYDLRQGKQEIVKKLRRPLFSIATHPYDQEFCVSGSDSYVRVFDIRNTRRALKLLFSQRNSERKSSESVTCAVYNDTGTEILASYSDDDIYLYDNTVKQAMVKPIGRFQGHCNTQTIKGVNFFGPRSEFVVSGSDCGYIFIWDKRSGVIVNWLNGDRRGAVNCLEPHPEFPILATSGVDDDIKIWVPKGPNDEQTVPVFSPLELRRTVRRNINDRRQSSFFPRALMFPRPSLSAYLHNANVNSFRHRLTNRLAAEIVGNGSNRSNNDGSDSDMLSDLDDDLEEVSGVQQMLRCNPS